MSVNLMRLLRRHPRYVALSSAILSLGIGINLLVFSIVNALWLRPLPVFDPDRVVTILGFESTVKSMGDARLKVFTGPVAGQVITTGFNDAFKLQVLFPGMDQSVEALGVTPSYFAVLGVRVKGREFAAGDERIGAEAVAIISDRLWTRAFDRADIIGAVIQATPRPLRVIGIAPPKFEGARRGERADLWVPTRVLQDGAPDDRQIDAVNMMVFARLGPDQSVVGLEHEYRSQLRPSVSLSPDKMPQFARLSDVLGTSDSPSTLIRESGTVAVVSGLSLLVLLGGCATIAALVLTHYELRRAELAIRTALGASRATLGLELAAELFVVGLIGCTGAIACGLLAAFLVPALSLPGGIDLGRLDLSLDWRWCAMALTVTFLTLAVGGALPLWKATHGQLAAQLSTRPAATGRDALRARRRLLSFQVFATTIVLLASGLLVRTVLYSFRTAAGFDIDRTIFVSVEEKAFSTTAGDANAVGLALERRAQLMGLLEQLPSVRAVAGGTSPIGADARPLPRTLRLNGREERLVVGVLAGTPNLLPTLGVPLLAGRGLNSVDDVNTVPTPVVITRSLAERLWTSRDALNQTFALAGAQYVVVGIAEDFAFGTLSRPVAGVVVTAKGDWSYVASNMVVHADDPANVAAAVRKHLPGRIVRVATGREIIGRDISQQRLGAWMFSGFGFVALLLGVGGVFGVVAYMAQVRRREFGLRMALGASLLDVILNAITTAMGPVALGTASGLVIGGMASRVFAALLVGIGPLDPGTYASVSLVVLLPAALAALAAAWRLRRVTPSDALRGV